jgi:hypothetical protein
MILGKLGGTGTVPYLRLEPWLRIRVLHGSHYFQLLDQDQVQNHSIILKKVNFNSVKVCFLIFVWQYDTVPVFS